MSYRRIEYFKANYKVFINQERLMKYFALTGVVLATLITGCAQMGGAQEPDAIPQKSVIGEPRTWSHPSSFDAVPA